MIEAPSPDKMLFDNAKLKRLIVAHDKAQQAGDDTFIFDGHKFLTRYAYYLIQYLNNVLDD